MPTKKRETRRDARERLALIAFHRKVDAVHSRGGKVDQNKAVHLLAQSFRELGFRKKKRRSQYMKQERRKRKREPRHIHF